MGSNEKLVFIGVIVAILVLAGFKYISAQQIARKQGAPVQVTDHRP